VSECPPQAITIESIHTSLDINDSSPHVRVIWGGIHLTLGTSVHMNETAAPVSWEQPACLLVNNNFGDLQNTSIALHTLLDVKHCDTILRWTPTTLMVVSRAGYACSAQILAEAGHTHGDERPRLNPVQFNPKNQDQYLNCMSTKAKVVPFNTRNWPQSGDARNPRQASNQRFREQQSSPQPSPYGSSNNSADRSSGLSTLSTKEPDTPAQLPNQTNPEHLQQMIAQLIATSMAQTNIESRLLEEERRTRDEESRQSILSLVATINKSTTLADAERRQNANNQSILQQALLDLTQRQDQMQAIISAP